MNEDRLRELERRIKAEQDKIVKVYGDISECAMLRNVLRWIRELKKL